MVRLGWQVDIGNIVYETTARKYGDQGYRIIMRPALTITGLNSYDRVPDGTPEIDAGTILRGYGSQGWYMCGRLGVPGEFHGIQGFKTVTAAAFQLLKERGWMDKERSF